MYVWNSNFYVCRIASDEAFLNNLFRSCRYTSKQEVVQKWMAVDLLCACSMWTYESMSF